ncbi:MAG: hypothetical protein ABL951_01225 [Alphaproteobacteria bacterium]
MSKFRHCAASVIVMMLFELTDQGCLAQAQESVYIGSLLFSDNEQLAIAAALARRPPEGARMPETGAAELLQIPEDKPSWQIERLHLSALIYSDPRHWTLWFGKRQVGQNNVPPFLSHLQVTPNYVDLGVIPRPGADPIAVRLRPNQTFLIDQLRIAEGGPVLN